MDNGGLRIFNQLRVKSLAFLFLYGKNSMTKWRPCHVGGKSDLQIFEPAGSAGSKCMCIEHTLTFNYLIPLAALYLKIINPSW